MGSARREDAIQRHATAPARWKAGVNNQVDRAGMMRETMEQPNNTTEAVDVRIADRLPAPCPTPCYLADAYYRDDFVTIINGDAKELLRAMEPVEAIVTDPPYGLDFKGSDWDKEFPDWWLRLAMKKADVIAFTTAPLTMWKYPRPDWVCCWYRPAAQSRAVNGDFNHWSPVMVYGDVRFKVDVKNLHAMQHAKQRGYKHPSPKPEALMRWIVGWASEAGQTVCDPFAGSGATLAAAKLEGCRAIGFEINEEYCELAANRCRQTAVMDFAR